MLDALHGLIVATAIASTSPTAPDQGPISTSSPLVPATPPVTVPDPTAAPAKPEHAVAAAPAAKSAPAASAEASPTPVSDPRCVVALEAGTSPAAQPCDTKVASVTGGSGDAAGEARGGSSGDASAVIEVPAGPPLPVLVSTATSGPGGAAVVTATSGATGDVKSSASCTIVFTASHVIITGDVDLSCYATAIARSGSSGAVQGAATGGNAGGAVAGVTAGGELLGIGVAHAGLGGEGHVVGVSGATGSATTTASCSFVLLFQDVAITGQLRLICVALAQSASGAAGAVTVSATGGTVGASAEPLGAGSATAVSGTVGTAFAETTCSTSLAFAGVTIGGGMITQCDSGPGTATVGVSGPVTQTPRTGSAVNTMLPVSSPGSLSAVTGAGGSATATPTSGATGSATALASCVLGASAHDLRLTSSVLLSCAASALAVSGTSGAVVGVAVGGSSGDARAGIRMVIPTPSTTSTPAPVAAGTPPTVVVVGLTDPSAPAPAAAHLVTAGASTEAPVSAATARLAYTGAPVAELAGLGGVAMLLGATMLGMSRPRRRVSASGARS